jgi:hypothetical protein
MTLTSGIINLFWGFVASATALGTIIGVVCLPITILPTILGIFEIIYAAKLLSAQPNPCSLPHPLQYLPDPDLLMGNIFSMVVGILVADLLQRPDREGLFRPPQQRLFSGDTRPSRTPARDLAGTRRRNPNRRNTRPT